MAETDSSQFTGFTTDDLKHSLFKDILAGINKEAYLESFGTFNLTTAFGYLADAETKDSTQKRITGLLGYELKYRMPGSNEIHAKKVVLKSKPTGEEVFAYLYTLIPDLEDDIKDDWHKYIKKFGVVQSTEQRELLFLQTRDPDFDQIMPDIYWSQMNEKNKVYVYAMEYLDPDKFSHLDTFVDVSVWEQDDILKVLQGLAVLHAKYYQRVSDIPASYQKYLPIRNKAYYMNLVPHVQKIVEAHIPHCLEEAWGQDGYDTLTKLLNNMESIVNIIDHSPKTLIHNDFSLRNLCLRSDLHLGKYKVCVYDWEQICIGHPQQDLADCMPYFMKPDSTVETWNFYIESYFGYLQKELHRYTDSQSRRDTPQLEEFKKVFDASLMTHMVLNYGGVVTVMYRKYKWPQARGIFKTVTNYIQAVSSKYAFL